MKFDIVIAHYKENLDWTRGLKHPLIKKVYIYSKSNSISDLSSELVEHSYLTNVGRESHTYLWHCVHNWRPLSDGSMGDFTFFVQGSPHGMGSKEIIEWIEVVEEGGLDFTHNYKISNPQDFLSAGRCFSWGTPTQQAEGKLDYWCDRYVKKTGGLGQMPVFWNACFGVSTECVLKSGRLRLATLVQKELSTINPECGHFCERLWYYIFKMDEARNKPLPENVWHFWGGFNGERHYGVLKLNPDGTVGLYDNGNERYWKTEGSSLCLLDSNSKTTSILERKSDEEYSGRFLGGVSLHRLTRKLPVPP